MFDLIEAPLAAQRRTVDQVLATQRELIGQLLDTGAGLAAAQAAPARERTSPVPPADREVSLADVTERLMTEFGDRVSVSGISAIVLGCRQDLAGSPVLALPELVERLARQRLLQTPTGG